MYIFYQLFVQKGTFHNLASFQKQFAYNLKDVLICNKVEKLAQLRIKLITTMKKKVRPL